MQPSRGSVLDGRRGREDAGSQARLYAKVPLAKSLGPKDYAILVFASVTKAGLGVGPRVVVVTMEHEVLVAEIGNR